MFLFGSCTILFLHGVHAGSDNVLYHQLDISDPTSVNAFAEWVAKHASPVSVLVNNAGEGTGTSHLGFFSPAGVSGV